MFGLSEEPMQSEGWWAKERYRAQWKGNEVREGVGCRDRDGGLPPWPIQLVPWREATGRQVWGGPHVPCGLHSTGLASARLSIWGVGQTG